MTTKWQWKSLPSKENIDSYGNFLDKGRNGFKMRMIIYINIYPLHSCILSWALVESKLWNINWM